jgi:hypothetical protein
VEVPVPTKPLTFIFLAFAVALLARPVFAKPVNPTALDACILRGGTIINRADGGKDCCAKDNQGHWYCVICPKNSITCDKVQVPKPSGTKKR